jgi:hypothetical protein
MYFFVNKESAAEITAPIRATSTVIRPLKTIHSMKNMAVSKGKPSFIA